MTTQPHHGLGHITNTRDPGWCVYCGDEIPPPPVWIWDFADARQEIIVRAAEAARWQYQTRRRRAERLATFRSAHAAMARATSAAAGLATRSGKDAA